MNHGIVKQIADLLTSDGPSSARELAAKIEPPDYWDKKRLHRNIGALLPQYAGKRWRKLKRGVYAELRGPRAARGDARPA